MSPLDQVLAAARSLESCGKTPSLALLKTRLGTSLPLPILIQGLQQFKAMSKAEREQLASLENAMPSDEAPTATPPSQMLQQLITEQQQLQHVIAQQQVQIQQLQHQATAMTNEMFSLKEDISALNLKLTQLTSQGKNV